MSWDSKHYDVTAFGELLIDFLRDRAGRPGAALFARNAGGAPANVLVEAARLGARTAFLGKVGKDMHGDFLRRALNDCCVNTDGLISDDRYFTTMAFVDVEPRGERSFSFARKPGADTQMEPSELRQDILQDTRILHVGSLSLTDEPSRETTYCAVRTAREAGALISYDPNYRASLWRSEGEAAELMRSLLPYADVVKLAEEETELLTGIRDPEKAAEAICGQGTAVTVITLGNRGCMFCCREGIAGAPGFRAHCVDTTGAGDSFWGAFLYRICAGGIQPAELTIEQLRDYTRFANAAASLCVEGEGAIPSMPDMDAIRHRMNSGYMR